MKFSCKFTLGFKVLDEVKRQINDATLHTFPINSYTFSYTFPIKILVQLYTFLNSEPIHINPATIAGVERFNSE